MLPALLIAAAAVGEIPITSSSPQAVQAFRNGREKALNFQIPESIEQFKKALALDPTFVQAQAWLGKVTPGASGLTQLEKATQAAASLSPAERKSVEVLLAERRGEDERVRTLKREIADLAPGDWLAQFQLGVQSFYDRKSQATILYMTKALQLNPRAAEAYNYRGYTLASQGQFEEGLADLRKCVELNPQEPNSWDSYGEVLMLAGRFDEAEKNFAKSAQMAPDNWMSWVGIAYARFFRGDYDGGRSAALSAKRYISQASDELAVDLTVAWSYLGQGKSKEALAVLDDVEKRARQTMNEYQFAWVAFERAEMFLELGRFKEASDQIEVARGRGSVGKLTGAEQNKLRRATLVLEARIAAALSQPDAADRALDQLQAELANAPSNFELRSTVHYATGLAQVARRNSEKAAKSFALCARTDFLCRRDLLEAQLRSGATAAAEDTRAGILAANVRDDVHRGGDPDYLYVATRLRGGRR
jgi:tetratricopeptide (TPR) repeat protein